MPEKKPNVLFIMTDQQRFDTINALGNDLVYTPNLDRLVKRGVSFNRAYSTTPVCVPARYTIRTGCESCTTRVFKARPIEPAPGQADTMEGRCGPYLARAMSQRGYRTFGIGKFHSKPWDEDLGYDVHMHAEEGCYESEAQRERDAYAGWIKREHPEYDYVEMLNGTRADMYYVPQNAPLPAECTSEHFVADRAVEQIQAEDDRPYFGMVSFIAPHPPLAPPQPFNRIYNPDNMPNPVLGNRETDLADEMIRYMNHGVWAENINENWARNIKARYYAELTFMDYCLGKVLDAVEAGPDGDNTLICFFSDHGDHLGDHHAWQKESYFEASCHIPFLVSWPARLPVNARREEFVKHADLFGLATSAAGDPDFREGMDLLGMLEGRTAPRNTLIGYHEVPGTFRFKIMVREGDWKYIYMANGGVEQLFNMQEDPNELINLAETRRDVVEPLYLKAVEACKHPGLAPALDGDRLKALPYTERDLRRLVHMEHSRGAMGYPERPGDVIEQWIAKNNSNAMP